MGMKRTKMLPQQQQLQQQQMQQCSSAATSMPQCLSNRNSKLRPLHSRPVLIQPQFMLQQANTTSCG